MVLKPKIGELNQEISEESNCRQNPEYSRGDDNMYLDNKKIGDTKVFVTLGLTNFMKKIIKCKNSLFLL